MDTGLGCANLWTASTFLKPAIESVTMMAVAQPSKAKLLSQIGQVKNVKKSINEIWSLVKIAEMADQASMKLQQQLKSANSIV